MNEASEGPQRFDKAVITDESRRIAQFLDREGRMNMNGMQRI